MTGETYKLVCQITTSVFNRNSLRAEDLDDVVQEVALRVHKAQQKETKINSLEGLVYTIACCKLIDLNRRKPVTVSESSLGTSAPINAHASQSEPDPQYFVELRDLYDVYVHRSSKDEALLTRLYFELDLTDTQIAFVLGVSLSTAKRRIKQLKDKLRRRGNDEFGLLA